MSAGPETRVRTDRGAMLYDASRSGQLAEPAFEPGYWRGRVSLEEVAGGRGTVAFVRDGDHRWVLRHYRRGGAVARLLDDRYLWTGEDRTRSFREWRLLHALHQAGLPVPAPVAARYVRSALTYRADLVTEELPTRLTLARALANAPLEADRWRGIGRVIGRLHAHGVRHADLNAHNLLLAGDGAVYVVDFDRGRFEARGGWERDVLDRLHRSLAKVTAGLPPERWTGGDWKALLEGVAAA